MALAPQDKALAASVVRFEGVYARPPRAPGGRQCVAAAALRVAGSWLAAGMAWGGRPLARAHRASGGRRCLRSPARARGRAPSGAARSLVKTVCATPIGGRPRMGPAPAGTTTRLQHAQVCGDARSYIDVQTCIEARAGMGAPVPDHIDPQACMGARHRSSTAGGSGVRAQAPFAVSWLFARQAGVDDVSLAYLEVAPRARAGERMPGPSAALGRGMLRARAAERMPGPTVALGRGIPTATRH